MHKKFEIHMTKIKSGCQSGRKVVTHNSMSDLPLDQSFKINVWFTIKNIVQGSKYFHGYAIFLNQYKQKINDIS